VDWNTLFGEVGATTRARFLDTFPRGRELSGGEMQRTQDPYVIDEELPKVEEARVVQSPIFWPAPDGLTQADVATWTQAIRELQNVTASATLRGAAALKLAGLCRSVGEAEGAQFFADCAAVVAVCGAVTNRLGPDDVAAIKETYRGTQTLFDSRVKDLVEQMTTSEKLYRPVLVPGRFCPDRTRRQFVPVEVKTLAESKEK
jgi:hypothetical protein